MTSNTTNATIENLKKYQFGSTALKALKSGNRLEAEVALDGVFSDLGDGHDYQGFAEGAKASVEGLNKASKFYGNEYMQALNQAKLGDIVGYLESGSKSAFGDNFSAPEAKVVKAKLGQYAGQTLEEIDETREKLQSEIEKITQGKRASNETVLNLSSQLSAINDASGMITKLMEMNDHGLSSYVSQEANDRYMASLKDNVLGIVGGQ